MFNIAPPPPALLNTLEDLIAFVKNVDQVAQLVADLKASMEANAASIAALNDATTKNEDAAELLEDKQLAFNAQQASLLSGNAQYQENLADLEHREEELKGNLQQFADAKNAFDKACAERQAELDNLQASAVAAQSAADKASQLADSLKAEYEQKIATLRTVVA